MDESDKGEWRRYLEELIYMRGPDRRFSQDSPIMFDVWVEYGAAPDDAHDLLLTPHWGATPGDLATLVRARLDTDRRVAAANRVKTTRTRTAPSPKMPSVGYNSASVAVELRFHELIRAVLPLSYWWHSFVAAPRSGASLPRLFKASGRLREQLEQDLAKAISGLDNYTRGDSQFGFNVVWMARVVGTMAMYVDPTLIKPNRRRRPDFKELRELSGQPTKLIGALFALLDTIQPTGTASHLLWAVNVNRRAIGAMYNSVPAIKADAAHRLFEVRGRGIRWAVLDSGIDAEHIAFRERDDEGRPKAEPFKNRGRRPAKNQTRIKATYDFTKIRQLLGGDQGIELLPEEARTKSNRELLARLERSLQKGVAIDWSILEQILVVPHDSTYRPPISPHGTHVAGILGADWRPADKAEDKLVATRDGNSHRTGVCPEIELYDIRVLDDHGVGNEFGIEAALQFVRYLNARVEHTEIHGVNLSFSIPHAVATYACGRTPVCEEAERVVRAGIVAVAAAGNDGYVSYRGADGRREEVYRNMSITDPGNAEAVITVGATHGRQPHTYGVSYFSSRGPTGDGRLKPDLVAPGEKIFSTYPGNSGSARTGRARPRRTSAGPPRC